MLSKKVADEYQIERLQPTDDELKILRDRFVEYRALDYAQKEAWRPLRENDPSVNITLLICSGVYRVILFCAAVIVIFQFVQSLR